MNSDTALRILGLAQGASKEQIEQARRHLLSALHPDKHPSGEKAVFDRLASDVNEATRVLLVD